MKLFINESKSKYPPCPTKEKKRSYRSKQITKICDDGLELTFEILPNRTTAIEFIYDMLNNYGFPWAQSDWKLDEYNKDIEYYEEDMDFYANGGYIDKDISTYIEFNDGSHMWVEEEDLVKNAIKAYRGAYKVERLFQSTGYDTTMYGGYIYYDEDYGDWNADLTLPEDIDFNSRNWNKIGKTYIEERD